MKDQEKANGEAYHLVDFWPSKYHKYLEWIVHKYFRHSRVVRPELKDGGLEWFLTTAQELVDSI